MYNKEPIPLKKQPRKKHMKTFSPHFLIAFWQPVLKGEKFRDSIFFIVDL